METGVPGLNGPLVAVVADKDSHTEDEHVQTHGRLLTETIVSVTQQNTPCAL